MMKEKKNKTLLVIVLFFIIIAFFRIILIFQFQLQKKELRKNPITNFDDRISTIFQVYNNMADILYYSYIDNREIKDIFYKGVKAEDIQEKNYYRNLLYNKLSPLYDDLKKYNFRQLHFHDKNNKSFLRMHSPDKFDDDLTGIRTSVEYVNKNIEKISGFEEGRIFNGYRFVYPLLYDNEHIGSVEISVSMELVIKQLKDKFNQDIQFIILRDKVEKKVFQSKLDNYKVWEIDDRFMLDKNIKSDYILYNKINKKDIKKLQKCLSKNKNNKFAIEIKVDNKEKLLIFIPIANFECESVAYFFSVFDSKFYMLQGRINDLLHIIFFSVLLLFFIFIFYYQKMNNKIAEMAIYDFLTKVYSRGVFLKIWK